MAYAGCRSMATSCRGPRRHGALAQQWRCDHAPVVDWKREEPDVDLPGLCRSQSLLSRSLAQMAEFYACDPDSLSDSLTQSIGHDHGSDRKVRRRNLCPPAEPDGHERYLDHSLLHEEHRCG